jgi:Fe-S-cluster containining protein
MGAGCAGCGSCCDPVILNDETYELLGKHWTRAALDGTPDPRTDEGWEAWRAVGNLDADREWICERYPPDSDYRADADFIAAHWRPLGDHEYRCDRFDPVHRKCMAYGDRPPVCRNYPWYGREPSGSNTDPPPQCSYLADLPAGERPEGSRPLIPLAVLRG